jgi:hypothetical protein
LRVPAANAAISARVRASAGLEGCRELRTASSPPGSAATSAQAPPGLPALPLRQVTGTWSPGMPFARHARSLIFPDLPGYAARSLRVLPCLHAWYIL